MANYCRAVTKSPRGTGGEWGLGLTELARDQIVNAVGYRLISLYRLIGPTAVIVILVMFIVGMARMLIDILVRAIIIARVRGWGFWMFRARWDTAFQVAVSPFRWAVEERQGRRWPNQKSDGGQGGICAWTATGGRAQQCGGPGGLGGGGSMEWHRPFRLELEEQTFL